MVARIGLATGLLVLVCATASAEPVGLLPIQSRWVRASELTVVADALVELGRELGLDVRHLDVPAKGCFRNRACYQRAADAAGMRFALGVDVIRTSSGRLHIAVLLIDTGTASVRDLGMTRSQPAVLRVKLQPMVATIREAIPRAEPGVEWPLLPPNVALPDMPAPPDAAESTPTAHWYQSINVNAFVSTSFTYNANRPPTKTNALRVFDDTAGAVTIDVAELVVQRAVDDPGSSGFRIDLVAGSAIPRISAAAGLFRDETGKAEDFDLQQAHASYIAPLGRGLRIDAGKFVTPAGAELIDGYDGFGDQYSRSFLFGYAVPFTHTGLRLAYPFHDRVSLAALATNGWDVVRDNNDVPALGTVLTILPATDLTIAATYLGGPERPDDNDVWRHLVDLVATWKPLSELTLMANVDYARDGGLRWFGVAGYLRVDIARRLAIAARAETFHDPDGARTGTPQRLWEATVTSIFRVASGLTMRLELRNDHSSVTSFSSDDGDRRSQLTGAINATYAM